MKHVLLLNPPGSRTYLREYFCGKASKASYLVHPVDLLMISGLLRDRFRVSMIDAMAERLAPEACMARIQALSPDAAIVLTASVCEHEDLPFAEQMKKRLGCELIAIGENFFDDPEAALARHGFLDALLLGFVNLSLPDFLEGGRGDRVRDVVYRDGDTVVRAPADTDRSDFEIGVPLHELLPLKRYRFPFARSSPYGTLLTDYGCPYKCAFCLIGTLSYRRRRLENVHEELEHLHRLGIRELYIDDQTFMPDRKRAEAFCGRLESSGMRFGWTCYARADLADEGFFRMIRRAGCHTVIIGVESGSDTILEAYDKGLGTDSLREAFATARKVGLETVGTFIIGLPGETEQTCRQTIRFALDLDPDFASFNTPIPRAYTPMRKDVLEKGWADPERMSPDQSGSSAVINTPYLSEEMAYRYRNLAERSFYLRPSYLLRRLLAIRSRTQAFNLFHEGAYLLGRMIKKLLGGKNSNG